MALIDQIQLRYSAKRLAELTRPEQADYSTPDLTFLANVCDDVEGYFSSEGAGEYSDDDKAAVAVACDGVVALAQYRITGSDGNTRRWENWIERLGRFRQVNRNDRVEPVASADQPRRFSDEQARDLIPGAPGIHNED